MLPLSVLGTSSVSWTLLSVTAFCHWAADGFPGRGEVQLSGSGDGRPLILLQFLAPTLPRDQELYLLVLTSAGSWILVP